MGWEGYLLPRAGLGAGTLRGWGLVDVAKTTRSAQGSRCKPPWSLADSHWHSWVPQGEVLLSSCALPLHLSSTGTSAQKLPPSHEAQPASGRGEGAAELCDCGLRRLIPPGQEMGAPGSSLSQLPVPAGRHSFCILLCDCSSARVNPCIPVHSFGGRRGPQDPSLDPSQQGSQTLPFSHFPEGKTELYP